ncbi:MAG: hypothetical protein QXY45_01710 [Candidatus Aenigmatarchaeota archaeon]
MVNVELTGFDDFGKETIEMIRNKMKPLLLKYGKIFGEENIGTLRLHVKTLKKGGKKDVHELTMSLNTSKGDFKVKRSGWDILALVDDAESVLESQFKKKKEKLLTEREGRA